MKHKNETKNQASKYTHIHDGKRSCRQKHFGCPYSKRDDMHFS